MREPELVRTAELAPALRESLPIQHQRGVRVAGARQLLLQRTGVAAAALVGRVKSDEPASAVDPVVAFDQLCERVSGGRVERPDRVGNGRQRRRGSQDR